MIVRMEAQDKLRETQIQNVRFRPWECRDPRFLEGLRNTDMGPSADASCGPCGAVGERKSTVEAAFQLRRDDSVVLDEHKLILVNPETGLPLY
jgi:hypothetical protein